MLARSAISPDAMAEGLKEEVFDYELEVKPEFKPIKDQDKLNELSMLLTDFRYDDEDKEADIEAYMGNGIIVAWDKENTDHMVFELASMFLVKDIDGWNIH